MMRGQKNIKYVMYCLLMKQEKNRKTCIVKI